MQRLSLPAMLAMGLIKPGARLPEVVKVYKTRSAEALNAANEKRARKNAKRLKLGGFK